MVINYSSRSDEADKVVAAIEEAGGRAAAVQGDVADENAMAAVFDAADGRFGELDAVWQRYGDHPVVLTFVSEIGARLPVITALDWSHRLRQAGPAPPRPA